MKKCEGQKLVGITTVVYVEEVKQIRRRGGGRGSAKRDIRASPCCRQVLPQRWAAIGHAMTIACKANKIFLNLLLHRELDECALLPSSHVDAFQFSRIEMHLQSRL
jgi:hypothetical protein